MASVLSAACSFTPVTPPSTQTQAKPELKDIPAPEWLRDAETFALANDFTWETLAASKISYVTHCPVNPEYFERMHGLGIRAIPYVTFYQSTLERPYGGLVLREHPELLEIGDDGEPRRTSFWDSEDAKNMYLLCPNVAAFQDAVVAWVKDIMARGADGVFVDNLIPRRPCAGERFHKHQHLYATQTEAFAKLLERVRAAVKEARPDGVVLGNSGVPQNLDPAYWPFLDSDMMEGYVDTWTVLGRGPDWRTYWDKQEVQLAPFLAGGKHVQAVSFLGHTSYGVHEDAYFAYASARIAGFSWSGSVPISTPGVAELYEIRLGRATGPRVERGGVVLRPFEHGLVALNPDKHPSPVDIHDLVPTRKLVDLARSVPPSAATIDLDDSHGLVTMPPEAGRVFLYGASAFDQLYPKGARVTVTTSPPLGNVRFRVDGLDYFTHSGFAKPDAYDPGPDFGRFVVIYSHGGRHVIELPDQEGSGVELGPAPARGSGSADGGSPPPAASVAARTGRSVKFRFEGWEGVASPDAHTVEVDSDRDVTVTAKIQVE
jgi:hypothetical protein